MRSIEVPARAGLSCRRMRSSRSALQQRAHSVIPGGAHTYSKGDDQFPANTPAFLARGEGARVWDPEGREYLDWGMGLRSVILGHAYGPVLDAVRAHLPLGSNFTRAHPLEVEFAEELTRLIPSAEMVKFAKNGSDATSAAVRLARAFTGRDVVLRCEDHPFLSVGDWFIGDTAMWAGVPQAVRELTRRFRYNRLDTLEAAFAGAPGRVACAILEPASLVAPDPGFLAGVRDLCRAEGALLVFDEVVTGFRLHPSGAQALFGVTPDLTCLGKAMGNGFAISALVGRRDVLEQGGLDHAGRRVFLLSTTHGAELHTLAAARKTVSTVVEERVCDHVTAIGGRLRRGLRELLEAADLGRSVATSDLDASPALLFSDAGPATAAELRTLFLQEMVRAGILIPWIAPSFSHTVADVDRTLEAASAAFEAVRRAAEKGSVEGLLDGPPVKPVFRAFN